MPRIDATAQAINALINSGAHEAARDMRRSELVPLSAHFGGAQVAHWCNTLGLSAMLDLPLAIAAAHVVREAQGTPAITQFMAIVLTVRARNDEIAKLRTLSGVYCTGVLAWSGLGDIQREFTRINSLCESVRQRLSGEEALECLPGVLIARLLFGTNAVDSAIVSELLVTLVFDERLSGTARLRAATMLTPWFNFSLDAVRMIAAAEALAPLEADASLPLITRLIYRAALALALAQTHLGIYVSTGVNGPNGLRIGATKFADHDDSEVPQWLRIFVRRTAFELASRGNSHALAADRLNELEAIVDPAEASQVLLVRYGRSSHAMRAGDYAVALSLAQRCMELVRALEMPAICARTAVTLPRSCIARLR